MTCFLIQRFPRPIAKELLILLALCAVAPHRAWGGDADLKLSTNDGSSKFTVSNAAGVEVSSITSLGDAYFKGAVFIQNNKVAVPIGGYFNRDASNVTDTNSTTETLLYSVVVPGGLLSTNRGVRVIMRGQFVQNSGAARSWTLNLKLGSSLGAATVVATKSSSIINNGTTGDFFGTFVLSNTGTTNSQEGAVSWLGDRNGTPVSIVGLGTGAVDTTVDQTLYISVTFPVATATQTFTKSAAYSVLE